MGSSAKTALRRRLQTARAALSTEDLASRATQLAAVVLQSPALAGVRSCSAYVSVGVEPGTGPLLSRLRGARVEVLLPVLAPDRSLDWALDEGLGRLAPGPHGLLQPIGPRLGSEALATADLVLVPALAVDRAGHRLGRGGGYYDRALAVVPPGTPVLAVVYAEEVLDAVPVEPHDRPVTGALTPRGLTRFDLPRRP